MLQNAAGIEFMLSRAASIWRTKKWSLKAGGETCAKDHLHYGLLAIKDKIFYYRGWSLRSGATVVTVEGSTGWEFTRHDLGI